MLESDFRIAHAKIVYFISRRRLSERSGLNLNFNSQKIVNINFQV